MQLLPTAAYRLCYHVIKLSRYHVIHRENRQGQECQELDTVQAPTAMYWVDDHQGVQELITYLPLPFDELSSRFRRGLHSSPQFSSV